jgi:hypothetical protein
MGRMALGTHFLSPAEHKAMLDAERRGEPFLAFRDGLGDLRFVVLEGLDRLAIGRMEGNDLVLEWDRQVSRSHAQLERVGSDWTLVDDGLSRNGSQVNGERIHGRTRLLDGDVVRLGHTTMVFRAPAARPESTIVDRPSPVPRLTEAERRVLVALCAPFFSGHGPAPAPATNREIAEALSLSLDGVKTHVRALFLKLGIEDLPQGRKRGELARRALEDGLVTRADGP